jgi:outer membrane biosynthesis protein TonB
MPPDHGKRAARFDLLLASLLVTAGLVICGISLIEISRASVHLAQATQPLQPSTPDASDANKPAEPKPGGERPTTPAPEPARPDAQAQKEGVKPALPPAPAEKIAPPMQQK